MKEIKWGKFAISLFLSLLTGFFFHYNGHEPIVSRTAFSGVLLASLWISEAVSIYITSLIPLFLFPFLGIMDIKDVAPQYTQQIIFLFIGGFLMAYALEKVNLHKRMALWIILKLGASPNRLLLSFMLSSYFLSMWIVNTATTIMLLPAALAVLGEIKKQNNNDTSLDIPILLSIAYSASIGGTTTIIGTAPNSFYMQFFNENFINYDPVSFTSWISVAFPISLLMIVVSYGFFRWFFIRKSNLKIDLSFCRESYYKLGKFSKDELKVSVVFISTILLWFFRKDIETPYFTIPGWSSFSWIPKSKYISDSTVAMLSAVALFFIPQEKNKKEGIINWFDVQKLPLGILFLFGAGFCLAKSFDISGLSEMMAKELSVISNLSPILIVILLCAFMTFFTEITSNTASTMLILPILAIMVKDNYLNPVQILMPVTLSASFAFMLPVATPPNTIVFGTEKIPMKAMIRYGFWLNLIGIIIVSLGAYFLT